MNRYMITYLGGDSPSSPEEGQSQFAKYKEWLSALGEAAVQPMVPLKDAHTIRPGGSITDGSSVAMTGYTVIEAETIDGAIELARSCPFLDINGTLEIAEVVTM